MYQQAKERECQIIDFAIPGDQNIAIKEQEKIGKYQDLRIELQKVWNVKVVVIPVVIGALRTMLNKIHHYIKQIDIPADHGSIIRTGITCKKIPCHMRDLACRWFIVKKAKIF